MFFLWGRLEKRKGIYVLARAISHVLKRVPNAQFTVVGSDTFSMINRFHLEAQKNSRLELRLFLLCRLSVCKMLFLRGHI